MVRGTSLRKPTSTRLKSRISVATDVAKLAGVSQSAVSRAFTDGASIAESTRKKVLEAADVLGYRPNYNARALKTGSAACRKRECQYGNIPGVAGSLKQTNKNGKEYDERSQM